MKGHKKWRQNYEEKELKIFNQVLIYYTELIYLLFAQCNINVWYCMAAGFEDSLVIFGGDVDVELHQ